MTCARRRNERWLRTCVAIHHRSDELPIARSAGSS